jgi:hypothetical protein
VVVALTRSKCGRAKARADAGACGEGGVEFVHRRLEASDVCRLAARGAGRRTDALVCGPPAFTDEMLQVLSRVRMKPRLSHAARRCGAAGGKARVWAAVARGSSFPQMLRYVSHV